MKGHEQATLGASLIGNGAGLALAPCASHCVVESLDRPFTDALPRCEQKWAILLAGRRYEDARVRSARYLYEYSGLAAPAL
jgi:hypothetical protein